MHGGSHSALRRFTPDVQVQVSYGTQSSQPMGKTEPLCAIKHCFRFECSCPEEGTVSSPTEQVSKGGKSMWAIFSPRTTDSVVS